MMGATAAGAEEDDGDDDWADDAPPVAADAAAADNDDDMEDAPAATREGSLNAPRTTLNGRKGPSQDPPIFGL